jgi:hypothetical protein
VSLDEASQVEEIKETRFSESSVNFHQEQAEKVRKRMVYNNFQRKELSKLRGHLCIYPLQFARAELFKKTGSVNFIDDNIFT